MMKLLIADDEESIRNGLKVVVDWESLGFTVCTEATNGNEAVSAIKDYSPDLVLLDIKMPGLTGIEVMENINEYCKTQGTTPPAFIILSGFSQFEYAKNALNLGAKAYLLKPVDEDELTEKVIAIKNDILSNLEVQKDFKTAKKYENKEFFRNLLLKGMYDSSLPDNDEFTVIIFSRDYFPSPEKTLIEKSLENYFSFFAMETVNVDGDFAVILKNANEEAVTNAIDRFGKKYPGNCFIARGNKRKGFEGCIESFKEARSCMNYFFFISDSSFINASSVPEVNVTASLAEYDKKLPGFCEKAVFCIETYDKTGLENLCQEIKNSLFIISAKNGEIKQKFISTLMEMYNKVRAKYPEREIEDLQKLDVVQKILEKKSFNEAYDFFSGVLFDLIESFHTNTADSVIVKVIAYVKTNYSQDLKLETLGDLFNCNSAYLGKKFRKHTGVQFNAYLDNLRIEEAKNKLLNTDLKIYQISKLVGYANTDYFFMKFKKATGMTPKEFKDQGGRNE